MPTRAASSRTACIVGGGPAGLIAAEVLATAGVAVTVHDRMPSVGRKFLLAGHGGLNLTHSEDREPFLSRYGSSANHLAPMIDAFGPQDLRDWSAGLGEPTFVGSSGRVFPEAFRAIPLVRAWLTRLAGLGVTIQTRRTWTGWTDDGVLRFADGVEPAADATVFALGGASWPRLGSDGGWVEHFTGRGVEVAPLRAANVGVRVAWSDVLAERFAGTPLKSVALTVRGSSGSSGSSGSTGRGDAMVTRHGIEGGPVYAIGAAIRDGLDAGACVVEVDLRPARTVDELAMSLARRRPKESSSTWLRRTIGLDPVAIALLREDGPLPTDPRGMAALVKAVPVTVTDTMPIARAISTAGGIAWSEVDESLMLRRMPGTFVAGEMLDWEAPTGGYLLQASFATGVAAARGALDWLERPTP
ncbi:BaiN/RdsA family NAD(P)/FAD-dependent oxidoreductase [Cellulomonas edaphi]|uniref:TIGR03862 family flavoprotein n=1 Tax=Cellulomonas edaphi TaxID=3053468 RepID=A0ABT7S2G6_9CELL|nr:TIGR03862 family flavoprotein [Cellulomons edaphi]MDM7829808.1 TIGR03862 family flavoprotein [Cellulomons edaphi]